MLGSRIAVEWVRGRDEDPIPSLVARIRADGTIPRVLRSKSTTANSLGRADLPDEIDRTRRIESTSHIRSDRGQPTDVELDPRERLGGVRLRLEAAVYDPIDKTEPYQPDDGSGGTEGPQLVSLEGSWVGTVHTLVLERVRVGRHPENDLVLPSASVSKYHALFVREGGHYHVEDLSSTNGVIVNGSRIAPDARFRLAHGDNIRISDQLFLFRQESAFVDAAGFSRIVIDRERVAAEARHVLAEWFGSTAS